MAKLLKEQNHWRLWIIIATNSLFLYVTECVLWNKLWVGGGENAELEPDKGTLSDKEMARIKAIAGPHGTGGDT